MINDMMQDIIFKGYGVVSKKWLYGTLIHNKKLNRGFIITKCYTSTSSNNSVNGELEAEEVYPTSVGQYIGLRDKEGTCVYTGDIVEINTYTVLPNDMGSYKPIPTTLKAVVKYIRPECRYIYEYFDENDILTGDYEYPEDIGSVGIKVVDNIFNKE